MCNINCMNSILMNRNLKVLQASGYARCIAQMPVVLIPVHFDRDPAVRAPSCQRSIVLRPFCTADFMTGLPAIPGSDKLPMQVSNKLFYFTKRYNDSLHHIVFIFQLNVF